MRRYGAYLNDKVLGRMGVRVVRRSSLVAVEARHQELARIDAEVRRDRDRLLREVAARLAAIERQAGGTPQVGHLLNHLETRFESQLAERFVALEARLDARMPVAAATAAPLGQRLDGLETRLAELQSALERALPAARPSTIAPDLATVGAGSEVQAEVMALVAAFRPFAVPSVAKIRLGNAHDGGYVLLDDLSSTRTACSLGVGGDSSWDIAMAERGIRVHQYDHTPLAVPPSHPGIVFEALRVSPVPAAGAVTLAELPPRPDSAAATPDRAVLKIDIEGDEWSVLETATPAVLSRYAQILCEFHDFHRAADQVWRRRALGVMAKLSETFAAVHIHGNNYRPFTAVANVPFPQVFEVTFANRAIYQVEPSTERFPTPIDRPNDPHRPDMVLGHVWG